MSDIRFEYVLSNSIWFGLSFIASLFVLNFGDKLRKANFKLYWNCLNIFQLRSRLSDQNLSRFFFVLFVFLYFLRLLKKKFLMILRYIEILHWNICLNTGL